MGRDQRQVRFDMNIRTWPIPCECKGRKTPVRGTQLVGHGWSSLNMLEEVAADAGDEKPFFGEGVFESGTLARGARWADAEVSDDDDLRPHLDTLDSQPRHQSPAAKIER